MSDNVSWQDLQPVSYVHLHQQVLDRLNALMASGHLKPGDSLPAERVLAELFQISRGTLREAFRILEHQGLIETRPGGRRRLRRLPPEASTTAPEEFLGTLRRAALFDLLEARQALEERIVELACRRATPEDLEQIRLGLEASSDPDPMVPTNDRAFHLAIAAATHNFVFTSMMKLHMDLVLEIRGQVLQSEERRRAMIAEHRAIYEAITARDQVVAREAMAYHLSQVMTSLRTTCTNRATNPQQTPNRG